MISLEFFKWLDNLTIYDLAKLAKHILNVKNQKCVFANSKVTVKVIVTVEQSCYSARE